MTGEQKDIFSDWFEKKKFEIQKNGKVRDSGRRQASTKSILDAWKQA